MGANDAKQFAQRKYVIVRRIPKYFETCLRHFRRTSQRNGVVSRYRNQNRIQNSGALRLGLPVLIKHSFRLQRIDHILITEALKTSARACAVDVAPRKNERPSDHAPVVLTLGG